MKDYGVVNASGDQSCVVTCIIKNKHDAGKQGVM